MTAATWERNQPLRRAFGAMDLVYGAEWLVMMMVHIAKGGGVKIVDRCTLPLTGKGVHQLITDVATIDIEPEGLVLRELARGVGVAEVRSATEPELHVHHEPRTMHIPAGVE